MNENVADITLSDSFESSSSWFKSFGELLETELRPYPGRLLLTLRIALACTFVMFCIVVFRIPGGVLGAYSPLLISRDSFRSTKRSASWIAAACTLGAIEVVLAAMLSAGSPFLHLVWVWTSLLAVFYLVAVLRVYEASLALGLFITNTISVWDQPASADLRLRQTLFMLLAILIGCGISVLIELLFIRTHSRDAVVTGIQERLQLVRQTLEQISSDEGVQPRLVRDLRRYSARGTASLRNFISHGNRTFEEEQRLSSAIAFTGRLVDLSRTVVTTNSSRSPGDEAFCSALICQIDNLTQHLADSEPLDWVELNTILPASNPLLVEIERTLELLTDCFTQTVWEANVATAQHTLMERSAGHFFHPGSLRNTGTFKFAIRGALSAVLCYMLYMSLGWTGLNASIATCILTALPETGAARHKQLLRFSGVVLGACVIGFAVQIVILPQIDSIFSYMLLFSAVVLLGVWIATSGPRISYCGVQAVLAFELVNLGKFSLNSSLIPARDTILGIALGILAMWLIFDQLWATSSIESIREMLRDTIHQVADLSGIDSAEPATREENLERHTRTIFESFEKIWSMMDVSAFEAFPKKQADKIVLERARVYLPQLRALLLLKTGLIHHEIVSDKPSSTKALQAHDRCKWALYNLAHTVSENEGALRESFSKPEYAGHVDLCDGYGQGTVDLTESRLIVGLNALIDQIEAA
ncbi:FUSC family protein [Terriglobus albidus]|uniref:FUSC family protein n=1 Tax=Terriglobus albidus TaxID=1592106 RepID=UPI0021E0679B|nr:FUSC family protein [Terriglobus albidus]